MTAKDQYADLCAKNRTFPIFMQPWWLDAVCGPDNWNAIVVENGSEIAGTLVYFERRRLGRRVIEMPPLTQIMGPRVFYPNGLKATRRAGYEKWVLTEMIAQLPPFARYNQRFHHSITNWLPFHWKGFKQTTRYTYILHDIRDLDLVFSNIEPNYRTKIRKAARTVALVEDLDPQKFAALASLTYARQGKSVPYRRELFMRMDAAAEAMQSRKILAAEDSRGRIHSAVYLVWDSDTVYLHMVGEDPQLRSSGAGIYLTWKAICFASEQCTRTHFDFEGSMIEPVEQVRRDFGATQTQYFALRRVRPTYDLVSRVWGGIRAINTWNR